MRQYEWIFIVDDATTAVVADIYERYDALLSEHGDVQLLTVTLTGPSAPVAAHTGISDLTRDCKLQILRTHADLVTRSDIAERVGSTAQAVGQWVRGDRHRETPFPKPDNFVAGGVWLWGTVNEWLRKVGKDHESDVDYPTREDHAAVDLWLSTQHRAASSYQPRAKTRTDSDEAHRGSRWHRTNRSEAGGTRVPTAKSTQRLKWTGTDYEVAG
jgi:transcriptional regulator with XRE-family HTH domain